MKIRNNHIWNRYDVCGKFISIQSFYDNKATRELIYPDSEIISESYETLCEEHAASFCR
jgi:hypothetical protein